MAEKFTKAQLDETINAKITEALDKVTKTKSAVTVTKENKPNPLGRLITAMADIAQKTNQKELTITKDLTSKNDTTLRTKGFNLSNFEDGGLFAQEEFSTDIVDYLHGKTVIDKLGIQIIPTNASKFKIPKANSGAQAYWIDETGKISTSGFEFGMITSEPKKLGVVALMSNDMIRRPFAGSVSYVESTMQKEFDNGYDDGLLNGTGTNGEPLGLLKKVIAGNVVTQSGITTADRWSDLIAVIGKLQAADIDIVDGKWLMHPLVKNQLGSIRNSADQRLFPTILDNNTLFGFPIIDSTKIEQTAVYFLDADKVKVIDYMTKELKFSEEASIYDAEGNVVSLYGTDQSAWRLLTEVDLLLTYDEAIAKLNGITWA